MHVYGMTTIRMTSVQKQKLRKAQEILEKASGRGVSQGEVVRLVLSDYVFDETVTTLRFQSRRHDVAALAGKAILESKAFDWVSVEEPVFEAAWSLFLERPDKRWSFTDCTSFMLMENLD